MFALLHPWTTESSTKNDIDSVRVETWPWHSEPSYGQCSPLVVVDTGLDHTSGTCHLPKESDFTIFFFFKHSWWLSCNCFRGNRDSGGNNYKVFCSRINSILKLFFFFHISCCCCCCCHTLIFVATSMCLNTIGWLHVLMLLFKMFLWRVI